MFKKKQNNVISKQNRQRTLTRSKKYSLSQNKSQDPNNYHRAVFHIFFTDKTYSRLKNKTSQSVNKVDEER